MRRMSKRPPRSAGGSDVNQREAARSRAGGAASSMSNPSLSSVISKTGSPTSPNKSFNSSRGRGRGLPRRLPEISNPPPPARVMTAVNGPPPPRALSPLIVPARGDLVKIVAPAGPIETVDRSSSPHSVVNSRPQSRSRTGSPTGELMMVPQAAHHGANLDISNGTMNLSRSSGAWGGRSGSPSRMGYSQNHTHRIDSDFVNNPEHADTVIRRRNEALVESHAKMVESVRRREMTQEEKFKEHAATIEKNVMVQRQQQWLLMLCTIAPTYTMYNQARLAKASKTFTDLILPMLIRLVRMVKQRRRRQQLTEESMATMTKPTPDQMQKAALFNGWGRENLERLLSTMEARAHTDGEKVCLEGDLGSEMFVLWGGTVQVLIRNTPKKQRSFDTGIVVANLSAPAFFGEFTLLCDEPRSATIVSKGDVQLWVIKRDPFFEAVEKLTAEQRAKIVAMAEERRTANLMKMHKLKVEEVTCHAMFHLWDKTIVETLIDTLRPRVIRVGRTIYKQGDRPDNMYFVTKGIVTLEREGHPPRDLARGTIFGDGEVMFSELRYETATVTDPAEVWFVTKDVLNDMMMLNPHWVEHARETVNRLRATELSPLRPEDLLQIPKIKDVFPQPGPALNALAAVLQRRVYGAHETVCSQGMPVETLIILFYGKIRDRGVYTVEGPTVLGLSEMMMKEPPKWPVSLKAITRCDCYVVERAAFYKTVVKALNAAAARAGAGHGGMKPLSPKHFGVGGSISSPSALISRK